MIPQRVSTAVIVAALTLTGCGSGAVPKGTDAAPPNVIAAPPQKQELQARQDPNETCSEHSAQATCRGHIVATVSGSPRCGIRSESVLCQFDQSGKYPYPQSPMVIPGMHANYATVTDSGAFSWGDRGEDGNPISLPAEYDHILEYRQVYSATGWTIRPTEEGTTFTNDHSGHGLFVSVDNSDVHGF